MQPSAKRRRQTEEVMPASSSLSPTLTTASNSVCMVSTPITIQTNPSRNALTSFSVSSTDSPQWSHLFLPSLLRHCVLNQRLQTIRTLRGVMYLLEMVPTLRLEMTHKSLNAHQFSPLRAWNQGISINSRSQLEFTTTLANKNTQRDFRCLLSTEMTWRKSKNKFLEIAKPYITSHTKVEAVPNDTGDPPKTHIVLDTTRKLTLESCQSKFFRLCERKQKRYCALDAINDRMLRRWNKLPSDELEIRVYPFGADIQRDEFLALESKRVVRDSGAVDREGRRTEGGANHSCPAAPQGQIRHCVWDAHSMTWRMWASDIAAKSQDCEAAVSAAIGPPNYMLHLFSIRTPVSASNQRHHTNSRSLSLVFAMFTTLSNNSPKLLRSTCMRWRSSRRA